jgi:hypothetical protein
MFPIPWLIAKFQFLRLGAQKKFVASGSSIHSQGESSSY